MSGLKIACLGGGPASLYFSILMKKQNPAHEIHVYERGPRDGTWGFGVVFSADTLAGFMQADRPSYQRIVEEFAYWDSIDTYIHGQHIRSSGHGFCGMSRLTLLNILHDRCDALGVILHFNAAITDVADLKPQEQDLLIAGDGIDSLLREQYKTEFATTMDWRSNRFCWLGTTLPLDSFVFLFKENEHGWWWVHAYRYEKDMCTWIVECTEDTWRQSAMQNASEDDTRLYIENVFKEELQGHPLITNRSVWRQFPVVRNDYLYHDNMVLLGDAGRSAHFSIGSGTKLAMEDAMTLADVMQKNNANVAAALQAYQTQRKPAADRLQRAAVTSLHWFENIDRYVNQEAEQFTFNMLVRSKRVTYENLALRDKAFMRSMDRWFASHVAKDIARHITKHTTRHGKAHSGGEGGEDRDTRQPLPPMFQPFYIGDLRLNNRIQLSAMCQYSAVEGMPNEWHLVHYGARAIGGVGLMNTEMLCVSPAARITPGCAGIWSPQQAVYWQKIVSFIHTHSEAKVCAQLGHAGRKGASCLPWEGGIDQPLAQAAWGLYSASALPYLAHSQIPAEMTTADMQAVANDFVQAARHAEQAGFDMLEVHMAHGYLLSSFISPATNKRTDQFGGDAHHRMRFPLQVLQVVRANWPQQKPVAVRISATDWIDAGLSEADLLIIARLLADNGADIINVSTGQVVKEENPIYGRQFQAPYADKIRNELGIPVIVAGNITSADQANTLILAGRTDMVALARPMLGDPHFVLHAAAHYDHQQQAWPEQYEAGKFAAYALARQRREEYEQLRNAAKPASPIAALAIAEKER